MTPAARKKIITYFFNLGKAKYGESWRCQGSGLGMLHANIESTNMACVRNNLAVGFYLKRGFIFQ